MAEQPTIGFIGIGAMGWHMATNLCRAGHPLIVYDSNKEQQQKFVSTQQCRGAGSLSELGAESDVIITMLPTGPIVRQVYLQDDGGALATSMKRGSLAIDMSSADPTGTVALGLELKKRGITLIDAPVSGGTAGARDGKLSIMIGSDDAAAVERARPILAALGPRHFVMGQLGSGHAMKALNNFVAGTGLLLVIEAMTIGRKFGLDPTLMIDVMDQSTGRNFATANVARQEIISRKFATNFGLGLLAKDVKIASDLADDLKANTPLCRLGSDLLQRAKEVIGPAADHSEAVKYWEMLNGVEIGGERKV
jgi:3-hydroxyisobutyrate dehydrogenase